MTEIYERVPVNPVQSWISFKININKLNQTIKGANAPPQSK